jgi:uncharacterized protein (TIGR02145 family)
LANGGWINVANANLGATITDLNAQLAYKPTAAASTVNDKNYDPTVYGDWYQWGRKKDGHENRKVLAAGTNDDYLSTNDGVATNMLDGTTGQITNTGLVGKFIQRNGGDAVFDWRQYPETDENSATAPADAWTWNNPANNPCPSKWRLPTQAEWAQIISNNTWVWRASKDGTTPGQEIKPGGAGKPTSLFLPAAGNRNRVNGAQNTVGANGRYWSSTVTGTNSYYLGFTPGSILPSSAPNRSSGLTVRCVSESFE